jgi:ABC-type multidrug transport system ATPase subunit
VAEAALAGQPLLPQTRSGINTQVTTEALRVEQLQKFFPPALAGWRALLHPLMPATVPALRGVSFGVDPGEIVALVGANGAGKSTLLRILTTLLLPTCGHAWVGGADVVCEPFRVRQQLGYWGASDGSFYAGLSARENLHLFATPQ